MFYHVEFESSIASHRVTPVFVEIWIIRELQNFNIYNLLCESSDNFLFVKPMLK